MRFDQLGSYWTMKDHLLLQQEDLNRLRQQVKAAWAKLPDDVKAKLKSKILAPTTTP